MLARMIDRPHLPRVPVALALLVLTAACSKDPGVAVEARETAPILAKPPGPILAVRTPRVRDPRLETLRADIGFGRLAAARARAEELHLVGEDGGVAGPEAPLLRARLAALDGRNIEAIRLVESARRARPADPDVYATMSEIYAAAGKLDAAWDEIRAGDAASGGAAELQRARGVVWICRQGGARKGLSYLEEALRSDPDLPFLARPLGQAHLLLGKEGAAAGDAAAALGHAREAAAFDPDDVDVGRFLGEALALSGDFDGAITQTLLLVERGLPLGGELALLEKKAGIAALLGEKRERALDHFAAARRLGLSDEELATGARLLDEEVGARVRVGVAAYGAGDFAASEASFRRALALDPERIEARNHLGVVLFQEGEHAEAAVCWETVIATAAREGLTLPEPVHVNLARALALAGDLPRAREALETYLVHHPDGPWAAETRSALDALPAAGSKN
jgi:tetratricopeptide (TPR) repeat protein